MLDRYALHFLEGFQKTSLHVTNHSGSIVVSHMTLLGRKAVDSFARVHRFCKHAESVLRADDEVAVAEKFLHHALGFFRPPNSALQRNSICLQYLLQLRFVLDPGTPLGTQLPAHTSAL